MKRAAILIALAIPAAAGCAAIIGASFDAHPAPDAGGGDGAPPPDAGGSDAPVDTGPPVCGHAFVPPNKASGHNMGGTTDFWAGIYSLDYGDGNGDPDAATYRKLGFDIDRACTAPPFNETPTCLQHHPIDDGVDGRDNSAVALIFTIRSNYAQLTSPVGSKAENALLQSGNYGVALHVTGYDDQLDDDQVRVEWYGLGHYGADKAPLPDGAPPSPSWNGSDQWPIRADAVTALADGGYTPIAFDDHAYVAGGVLVASLPRGATILGGSLQLEMTGVFITANVANDGGPYRLDNGMVGGEWRAEQLLNGIAYFIESTNFCPNSFPPYATLHGLICSDYLDVSSQGQPSPTQPCDALSIGLGFTTKPMGPPSSVVDAGQPTTVCTVDPSLLTCPPQ